MFSSLSGVIQRRHQHSGTYASSSSSWEPASIWWGIPWITDWSNWGISFTSLSVTTPWCSRYNHVVWYGNCKTKSWFWNWSKQYFRVHTLTYIHILYLYKIIFSPGRFFCFAVQLWWNHWPFDVVCMYWSMPGLVSYSPFQTIHNVIYIREDCKNTCWFLTHCSLCLSGTSRSSWVCCCTTPVVSWGTGPVTTPDAPSLGGPSLF